MSWVPDDRGDPGRADDRLGHPGAALRALPGTAGMARPWHEGRVLSLLFRGKVDVDEVNELVAAHDDGDGTPLPRQRRDRPADGGDRGRPRLPPGPRRGEQGQGGRRPHARPRLPPARSASPPATRSRISAPPSTSAGSSAWPTATRRTRPCAPRSPTSTTSPSPRAGWATASTRPSSRRWRQR